jgi:thiol-disulfide isomerase/thioredoxin
MGTGLAYDNAMMTGRPRARARSTSATRCRLLAGGFFLLLATIPALAAEEPASEIPVFPNYSLIPLEGGEAVELESWRGRPVLLTFWASWCGPCRWELPELEELAAELGPKGFVLATVNVDDSTLAARRFLEANELDIPVYRISRAKLVEIGVRSIPTNILLDDEGRPALLYEGYTEIVPGAIREKVLAIVDKDDPEP